MTMQEEFDDAVAAARARGLEPVPVLTVDFAEWADVSVEVFHIPEREVGLWVAEQHAHMLGAIASMSVGDVIICGGGLKIERIEKADGTQTWATPKQKEG